MTFPDFHNIQSGHNVTAELLKMAYFGKYQGIPVSIETSAKCRYFTVMRRRADALFSKTKLNRSRGMLSYYILCCFRFPKLYSMVCRSERANMLSGKLRIFMCDILFPP